MKKSNRITSGVIILSMLASSTILCMTSLKKIYNKSLFENKRYLATGEFYEN